MASDRPKINKYSLTDLKNTTDDYLPTHLSTLNYTQQHHLTDVRLGLGFTACLIAGLTFYHDWTSGFEASKTLTLYAVIAYFTLNTLLTAWVWVVERGRVYVGVAADGKTTVSVESRTEKGPGAGYVLAVTASGEAGKHRVEKRGVFTDWFDEQGALVGKPLGRFLEEVVKEAKEGLEAKGGVKKAQ